MKKTMLFMLLAFAGYFAKAQTQGAVEKLSIGADFGLPTRQFSHSIIAGASIQYERPIAKALNLTANAGYSSVIVTGSLRNYLKSTGASTSTGVVPLKIGGKYYFGGIFYGGAELGAAINTGLGGGASFIYAPSFGTSFSVGSKSSLDFGLRYENWSKNGSSSSFIGLRTAFAFGL